MTTLEQMGQNAKQATRFLLTAGELKNKALYRLFFDRLLRIQIFSLQNKLNYQ